MTNCWFWNIAQGTHAFFAEELNAGRARQGWGYKEFLDLRKLEAKLKTDAVLTDEEAAAWARCSPMIASIEQGDLVVLKNVPEPGFFAITEVTGDYGFELGEAGDFGHYLPVENTRYYNKNAGVVSVELARALGRARHPIRRTRKHEKTVRELHSADHSEKERLAPEGFRERRQRVRDELVGVLPKLLKKYLDPKDVELLCMEMLESTGLVVEHTAGSGEKGADLVCTWSSSTSPPLRYAVQVKAHWGESDDTHGVAQLRQALSERKVQGAMLVTTASTLGPNLQDALDELLREQPVVTYLHGPELYEQLLNTLLTSDDLSDPDGDA